MFGEAQKFLEKIDCYSPDGARFCEQAHIMGVPTWKYQGEEKVGVTSLDELAEWVGFKK